MINIVFDNKKNNNNLMYSFNYNRAEVIIKEIVKTFTAKNHL